MKLLMQERKNLILLSSVLLLLVIGALIWAAPWRNAGIAEVSLTEVEIVPVSGDNYGVDVGSDFIIKGAAGLPLETLQQMIRTIPSVDFSLSIQKAGEYLLKLEKALKPHSMFSVVLAAEDTQRSWAFQTKTKFSILSTLPRDGATYVPPDRGVEIAFSHKDVPSPEPNFTISPQVEGRFEQHGSAWVFVPLEPLGLDTRYEVSIAADLKRADGEALEEEYQFSFTTDSYTDWSKVQPLVLAGEYLETFTSADIPLVELYYSSPSEKWREVTFQVELHTLATEADYLAALETYDAYRRIESRIFVTGRDSFRIDPTQLTCSAISSFETTITSAGDGFSYYAPSYIVLPESLALGWYLVDISAPEDAEQGLPATSLQKLIQIHDSAVYLQTTYETLLLWLNDTQTGEPLVGRDVWLNDELSGKTDAQGVALLEIPGHWSTEEFAYIKIDDCSATPFIVPVTLYGANETPSSQELYFTYLYTDRRAYQPTDTVQVWGVVRSRTGRELPREAILSLSTWRYSYRYGSSNREDFLEVPVELSANGVFSADLAFADLATNNYTLSLSFSDDKTIICSTGISILEYVKPIYTGDVQTTKPAFFSWENIEIDAEVTFFDGTPASGMPFSLSVSGYPYLPQNFSGNSDGDGRLRFSFLREANHYDGYNVGGKATYGWRPNSIWYSLSNAAPEDAYIYWSGTALVFDSDIMLRGTWSNEEKTLTVNSNRIDLSTITERNDVYLDDYRRITGDKVDLSFRLEIHQVTWHKIETGTIYDFINKQTVPQYYYEQEDKVVETLAGATQGGRSALTGIDYQRSELIYYYGVLIYTDTRGKEIQERVTLGTEINRYYADPVKRYIFRSEKNSLGIGQSTVINLEENFNPFDNPDGRLLYINLQSPLGYLGHEVASGTQFEFTFREEHIPGVQFQGAYFDGRNIYPVVFYTGEISFDPQERRLNIEVQSDRDNYQPGDTVTLEITVTDQENRPTAVDLYFSVVDEAAFAIANHQASPLSTLYQRISMPRFWEYTSYVQHVLNYGSMAEKGGDGGAGNIRKLFLDNAFTLATSSDASGRATVSFELPDNLTSWRITTQAVSGDLYAGDSRVNITTRIPFFVDLLLGRTYLVGDDLSLSLRSFGTGLQAGEEVAYRAVIEGGNITEMEQELTAKAGEYANLNFGTLPAGVYTVQAFATYGEYSDALEKTVRVVNHALELPLTQELDPEKPDIVALRDPVTLVFYDKIRQLQLRSAFHLLTNSGERTDQRLGEAQALIWLAQAENKEDGYYFGRYAVEAVDNLQTYQGGVRLLPDGEEVPILTAKICAAAPEYLDTVRAAEYLYTVIDNADSSPEQVAAAYMGLAALREPVLLDIRYLLQNPDGLEIKDRLYLCAALALIGDESGAKAEYEKLIRPLTRELSPWIYVNGGSSNSDTNLEWTALAAMSAVFVDREAAAGMISYILDNTSRELLTNLEIITFLRFYLPTVKEAAQFSFQDDGETVEVSLEDKGMFSKEFTRAQLETANIRVLSGELGLMAAYIGSAEEVLVDDAVRAKITKTIEAVGGGDIRQGGLVKITLTVDADEDAPVGCYTLTDMIPSGMRFTSVETRWGQQGLPIYYWSMSYQEGQRIVFSCIDRWPGSSSAIYYARVVVPGNFISESAYLQSLTTAAWGRSERGTVAIIN